MSKLHHEIEVILKQGTPTELDLAKAGQVRLKRELQIAHKLNEERAVIIRHQGEVAHKLRDRVAELQSRLLMVDPDGSVAAQASGMVRHAKLNEQHCRDRFNKLQNAFQELCEEMDWELDFDPEGTPL
jgi:hypothetical protein